MDRIMAGCFPDGELTDGWGSIGFGDEYLGLIQEAVGLEFENVSEISSIPTWERDFLTSVRSTIRNRIKNVIVESLRSHYRDRGDLVSSFVESENFPVVMRSWSTLLLGCWIYKKDDEKRCDCLYIEPGHRHPEASMIRLYYGQGKPMIRHLSNDSAKSMKEIKNV